MSENTNNEANAAAEVPKHKQMQARLQTEDYAVDPIVRDQINTLVVQLFKLCEANGVPMVCVTGVCSEGENVEFELSQNYGNLERVPKTFAAASRILMKQPFINREAGDEIIDAVTEIIGREIKKNPAALLMAQLGLRG